MTSIDLKCARRDLFTAPRVVRHIGRATALESRIVDTACRALLEADLLPCATDGKAAALATDGALVLMALGSRQTEPEAIVRAVGRLRDMRHQAVVGPATTPSMVPDEPRHAPPDLFVDGVAAVIRRTWRMMRAPLDGGDADTGVSVLWGDRGEVLYGVVDHKSGRRKHIYSDATLPVPPGISAEWDFVELRTVGGQIFTTLSIFQYAKVLKDSAVGTLAELEEL